MGRKGRPVIAIEIDNKRNEKNRRRYESMLAASRDLNINSGLIKMCCDGVNRIRSGFSKNEGRKRYSFIYDN